MAEKYPGWSPYNYTLQNPVNLTDPTGMAVDSPPSTGVTKNDDGTYTVVSADPNDGDRGVYIADENGDYDINTSEKVGNSITTHSFVDKNGCAVVGAIIDPNSTEGQDFVDGVMKENPSLAIYMYKGLEKGDYDFKNQGIRNKPNGMTPLQYRYRGSVSANGDFGSARDYGNITAGMVAARSGLSWKRARLGFDTYQGFSTNGLSRLPTPMPMIGVQPVREPTATVKAQMVGYAIGLQKYR